MTRLDPGQRPGSTQTLGQDGAADGGPVRRTVLPGGLRIITEAMPGVRSAALGVWVDVGSCDEDARTSGASHFLEHLLFKGTPQRDAEQISGEVEAVGGEMNAFTSKEYTCVHARVLDRDLPLAVDVVADMVTSSRIDPADVESEREVILEEIAMNDDDPDDVVHTLVQQDAWAGTPLGMPVAGEPASVTALSRDEIAAFYARHYTAPRTVVAVAGNVDHDEVVALVRARLEGGWPDGTRAAAGGSVPSSPRPVTGPDVFTAGTSTRVRPFEQANVVLAVPGLRRGDPRRRALAVLDTALGGGMSSRLFQEVRERRGLAYAVYSFSNVHADGGMLGVYAGCAPGKVDTVLEVCHEQLDDVRRHGLRPDELQRAKGQLRGAIVLGLEDSGSRMSRLGRADLLHGRLESIDDVLASIDAVDHAAVAELADELLARPTALAVVGPAEVTRRFAG